MIAELAATTSSVADLLVGWRLVTSLVGAMAIAVVAGRLLGVRRSWGSAVLSGLVGWVSGAILAVVLARSHEGGEAGFTRNLWLFATFFTMSATAWMEMLAKPGVLARAQGSLSSFPRSIRSLRRRSRRVSRYVQVSRIAARHGLGRSLGVPEDDAASAVDGRAPVGLRVRRALEEGGGVFVKLGQVLSTRSDLLPPAITDELARLQDRVALATLQPGYLVIDAARAMAAEWAREQLLPAAFEDLARSELVKLAPVLRRLPRHVDRLASIVERGDLTARVSLFADADDVRVITRMVNRGALAFLGAAVGLISVMLLGIKGGPEFTGSTSLYEFFGYFGLFCGTVLIMRVLVAILRDGLN